MPTNRRRSARTSSATTLSDPTGRVSLAWCYVIPVTFDSLAAPIPPRLYIVEGATSPVQAKLFLWHTCLSRKERDACASVMVRETFPDLPRIVQQARARHSDARWIRCPEDWQAPAQPVLDSDV